MGGVCRVDGWIQDTPNVLWHALQAILPLSGGLGCRGENHHQVLVTLQRWCLEGRRVSGSSQEHPNCISRHFPEHSRPSGRKMGHPDKAKKILEGVMPRYKFRVKGGF